MQILVPYADARREIRDADLLLFRSRSLVWRLVSVAGRSPYTHAAMAGWWGDRLMCVEMTSGGGRAQLLSNLVERWPGVIDVFRAHVRLFVRPETDDAANGTHPPFCSQAVALACRAGGVDPVPQLADRLTEPGDLARSPFFAYLFTLGTGDEDSGGTANGRE